MDPIETILFLTKRTILTERNDSKVKECFFEKKVQTEQIKNDYDHFLL